MVGSQCRRFENGSFRDLPSLGLDNDMGTGDILRVEPVVCSGCRVQGQLVVLPVIPAHQYREAVGGGVMQRVRPEFFLLRAVGMLPCPDETGVLQLRPEILDVRDLIGVVQVGEHRFQIIDVFLILRELGLLLVNGRLRLAVALEVGLGVLVRRPAGIKRNGDFLPVIIIRHGDFLHAGMHQVHVGCQ